MVCVCNQMKFILKNFFSTVPLWSTHFFHWFCSVWSLLIKTSTAAMTGIFQPTLSHTHTRIYIKNLLTHTHTHTHTPMFIQGWTEEFIWWHICCWWQLFLLMGFKHWNSDGRGVWTTKRPLRKTSFGHISWNYLDQPMNFSVNLHTHTLELNLIKMMKKHLSTLKL